MAAKFKEDAERRQEDSKHNIYAISCSTSTSTSTSFVRHFLVLPFKLFKVFFRYNIYLLFFPQVV